MRMLSDVANNLWGQRARLSYLMLAAAVLLFTLLDARDIWTQEHRWADIVSGMFYRNDFLHPYLGENPYYDKPLLSYWLIVAVAKLTGVLSAYVLRVPSALAGLLAVWSIYRLGVVIRDKSFGLLAGWLLLTTFYFLFWARTSSADMLNMAGSLFAVCWYATHRDVSRFGTYAIFFIIIALTSLCKGLVGAVVPLIVVGIDIVLRHSWERHLRWQAALATIPAIIIYLAPFIASAYFDNTYHDNGLYLVYKENILRYFQPFDHVGPIYTYVVYLPIYIMPWAIFFVPALVTIFTRWRKLSINHQWIAWSLLALFLFFTLSGSRRSYYVLPMVPFAILLTAEWLNDFVKDRRPGWLGGLVVVMTILLFLVVDIAPAWYYSKVGTERFAKLVKTTAMQLQPWQHWQVIMLDGESKLDFYLSLPPSTKHYDMKTSRVTWNTDMLGVMWPVVKAKPRDTIFITRRLYAEALKPYFTDYQQVMLPHASSPNAPVAFIPKKY